MYLFKYGYRYMSIRLCVYTHKYIYGYKTRPGISLYVQYSAYTLRNICTPISIDIFGEKVVEIHNSI